MKKELTNLIATDGAELKLNSIFKVKRELCRDEIMNRDIDNIKLYCDLPGFPAMWSERLAARDAAALAAEIESTMKRMMDEATTELTARVKAGKLG